MELKLSFTSNEQQVFLMNQKSNHYVVLQEEREFNDYHALILQETATYRKQCWIVYVDNIEIKCADEKDYRQKSQILNDEFIKVMKRALLQNCS